MSWLPWLLLLALVVVAAWCFAEIAAPRPEPPNRKFPVVEMPSVTGSFQRNGLCVGSSPRNVRESMATPIVGGPYSPAP